MKPDPSPPSRASIDPVRQVPDVTVNDFDAFYVEIFKLLVSRAVQHGCPPSAAPDLVQDVLIRLWRRWDQIRPAEQSRLALTAVRHEVIDRYRRRRAARWNEVPTGDVDVTDGQTWDSSVELTTVDRVEALRAHRFLVTQVPPRPRQVLLLVADGFTTEEIAIVLGIKPSGVRSLLHRARKIVKQHLEGGCSDAG